VFDVKNYEKLKMRMVRNGSGGTITIHFKDRPCSRDSLRDSTPLAERNKDVRPGTVLSSVGVPSDYIYRKYETTEPAVLTDIPLPKLTPEAIKFFEPGEMTVEPVLKSDGTIEHNSTLRGYLKNGMAASVMAAVRNIKFKPAIQDGRPVSQRVLIKYGIKRCNDGRVCTYASEIVD
jgi:hypothetical protein